VEYALIETIGAGSPGPHGRWGHPVADETVADVLSGITSRV
jgi:hypothetical protein